MRHPFIISNWKLNGNKIMLINFIQELCSDLSYDYQCNIVIAPPTIYLDTAKQHLKNSNIKLAAQNIDIHLSGAFTGEISAEMLKDIGVSFIIIGHSERRIYHKENITDIIKKIVISKKFKLTPILCIGENKEENIKNQTKNICIQQLEIIINTLSIKTLKNSIIAYEPAWAIGSGTSANPCYVQKIHKSIRNYIADYDKNIAEKTHLLYGGSVNIDNAHNLLNQPDIDGLLVGNASLNSITFSKIIKIANKIKFSKN
ncbi:triose-phosphate isomerase [Blochmannia endosymbiont of Colobopsis nipponica]|uniref:triose-phosphate isomerase n=1 Tax=Blochmannia endosymbiont of Colobopsis nipponica TaxID=2681987 RepID=UPI00177F9B31|nr:triose-phosphate isomerase [Blochmannia endosymbiont of Colobopsis nipponica]QOI10873.1 triose-phosphate isomerase [Blochmannia endosymbiont of Colobopsis nipponica]